ncbi:unnamed protein product (macronuclear) [Paramecium tetraurelia]|uniref:VWFA domain-containing protein n=1 Tax=Paramecium tetraurelia TaxID=5888 RepID=A0DBV9_PARTE|nr:uncharacterized protein GSPATT00015403001 [Paramecium tetraurelia]CAK80526.1 unnamed protein product [Paramecium tetraurelia]|eukprot:XP_001447923.1 hypothetical protein (macronuclear) [Paramecium tetraurelia strain d4-2]
MVKKAAPKKQETKKAPIRRTRTIQALIKDNENIVHEKLGQTRSKSNGVQQKKITKQTQEVKQKKVVNEKERSAPKKNSNQKEEKQPIKDDTKQKKQPEKQEDKKKTETKQNVKPVQKKVISKKKSTPKKSPVKKSTTKKTPVKANNAKEDTKPKAAEKKNEKEVTMSEKKVEEKSEKKNNEKSEKKVIDKSEKKVVDKSDKKANDKSEKKAVEKSDKKSGKKEQQKEQQEQKQTESAKLPRRTESKAAAGIVDVVFCVDTTSSMSQYINQTKNTVKEIIKNIKNKASNEDISVKFGFVCYRDHPPQDQTYVTKIQDLCGEDEIIKFIDQQNADGGGDTPEAVLDGLYDAAKKIEWRDATRTPSLRYIFHVADAPPHGKEFTDQTSQWPNGVPSGVNLDKVSHVINIREIHYRLINVNQTDILDKMKKLFKEKFTNYEETDLTNAKEMDFKVSDMIIRELLPDVDYND